MEEKSNITKLTQKDYQKKYDEKTQSVTIVKDGYMEKGIKDHLEFTYFITEKGLTTIKWNGGKDNE